MARAIQIVRERLAQNSNAAIASAAGQTCLATWRNRNIHSMEVFCCLAVASAARARRDFARWREQYKSYASVSRKIPTRLSQAQQARPAWLPGVAETFTAWRFFVAWPSEAGSRSRRGRHSGAPDRYIHLLERRESKAGFCAMARAVQIVRERLAQNSNAAIASAAGQTCPATWRNRNIHSMEVFSCLAVASAARARRDFARWREQYKSYASVSRKIPTPLSQAQQARPAWLPGVAETFTAWRFFVAWPSEAGSRSRRGRHSGAPDRYIHLLERRESKAGFCAMARAVQIVRERLAQNSNAAIASAAGQTCPATWRNRNIHSMEVFSCLAVASAARARRDFARWREQYKSYASVSRKIPTPLSQAQQARPAWLPGVTETFTAWRFFVAWPSRAQREQGGILRDGASSTNRTRASRAKFQRGYRKRSRPDLPGYLA